MASPQHTTGTTLAILAPYLPYEIEVEVGCDFNDDVERGLLKQLTYPDSIVVEFSRPGRFPIPVESCYPTFDDCRPVLRPFSALVKPLADGTVPAVEVAKLLANDCGYEAEFKYRVSTDTSSRKSVELLAWDEDYGDKVAYKVSLLADWNFLMSQSDKGWHHLENLLKVYDYLRSKQFAVGLEPSQFIPKQD